MVTNLRCEEFLSAKNQQTESTSETSKGGTRTKQQDRQSILVKWTYPEVVPKHFYVYAKHVNEMGVAEKKLIGQTRSCHFFVPNATLVKMDAPVHIEIVPVSPYHCQKETGHCKMLIKDVIVA